MAAIELELEPARCMVNTPPPFVIYTPGQRHKGFPVKSSTPGDHNENDSLERWAKIIFRSSLTKGFKMQEQIPLLSRCLQTNLIRRGKRTWEGRKAFATILLPSGTSQPALCALKAKMLSLHAGITISIDNSASSGDNTGNTCPSVPGIRYLCGADLEREDR